VLVHHSPNGSTEPLRLWISAIFSRKAEIAAQTLEDNERCAMVRRNTVAVMISISSIAVKGSYRPELTSGI
jgi:hypothetical protein